MSSFKLFGQHLKSIFLFIKGQITIHDRINKIRDCITVSTREEIALSSYHLGILNGLILAIAIIEDKEPQYIRKIRVV